MSAVRPLDLRKVFIELAATALVVGALSITLVGFHVKDVPGGFDLVTRFWDVLSAVVIGVVGRAWLIGLREDRPRPVALTATPVAAILLLALLSDWLLGGGIAETLTALLPFNSSVVQWIVAIVALLFAIVAVGRSSARQAPRAAEADEDAPDFMDRFAAGVQRYTVWVGAGLLLVALVLPFLPFMNLSTLDIAVLVLTYVMLGWGLNIVVGLAGLLDLGYVAFYAVGAYSFALMASPDSPVLISLGITEGISFWYALPFAGLMAALGRRAARLPGPASARRLSRHRDPGIRRDDPGDAAQLVQPHQGPRRHLQDSAARLPRPFDPA